MTMMQVMVGSLPIGTGAIPSLTAWEANSQSLGGVSTASITVTKDGGISVAADAVYTTGAAQWYNPITVDVGASYWARVTVTSGDSFNTGDTVGAWIQLNATRTWGFSALVNFFYSNRFKIEIATDSGGSNIVASMLNASLGASNFDPGSLP